MGFVQIIEPNIQLFVRKLCLVNLYPKKGLLLIIFGMKEKLGFGKEIIF